MGYTHYWEHRGFTDSQWSDLTAEVDRIIRSSGIPLTNGLSESVGTVPVINEKEIRFNGVKEDGCETFRLTKLAQKFEFCKTRHRPYDEVVVAVMRWAMHVNSTFNPSSDGGREVFL